VVSVPPPLAPFLPQERAEELATAGRFADDLPGIRAAYARLGDDWDATIEGARPLGARLDERVGGEWSFVQTIRHLVFVTDLWVGEVIEEAPSPPHPLGMPPDFLPPPVVADMGLTVDARPTLDEVVALLAERRAQVERVLDGLTPEGLRRTCESRRGPFQVVAALQVVLFETWAHHQFATRDLAVLEQE
jgi:DinB superfamily